MASRGLVASALNKKNTQSLLNKYLHNNYLSFTILFKYIQTSLYQ